MKKLAYILLITISLTGCKSCKKDQPSVTPELIKNSDDYQKLKDIFYFKTGSYWVYQDSIHPTQYDSVYVIKNGLNWDTLKKEYDCMPAGIYELFGTQTKGQIEGVRNFICESKLLYNCISGYRLPVSGSEYTPWSPFVTNNFTPGYVIIEKTPDAMENYGYKVTFLNNYDSITLNNSSTFKNVHTLNNYSFQYMGSSTTSYVFKYNTTFYFAQNKGIIKRVENDSNRVWNLVRYHVIQ